MQPIQATTSQPNHPHRAVRHPRTPTAAALILLMCSIYATPLTNSAILPIRAATVSAAYRPAFQ